jgi:hypothetical protein
VHAVLGAGFFQSRNHAKHTWRWVISNVSWVMTNWPLSVGHVIYDNHMVLLLSPVNLWGII